MTTEENKKIVRRFYQAFEQNDTEALKEVLDPELVAYNMKPQNRDEHIQGVLGWNKIFSENRFEVIEQVAEGDRVASRVILHSTHSKGSFQGVPPTGKKIEFGAITIEVIRNGKIVERRVFSDRLGMMQQLGVLPQPSGQ